VNNYYAEQGRRAYLATKTDQYDGGALGASDPSFGIMSDETGSALAAPSSKGAGDSSIMKSDAETGATESGQTTKEAREMSDGAMWSLEERVENLRKWNRREHRDSFDEI